MIAALFMERGLVLTDPVKLTDGIVGQCRIANLAMAVIANRMTNGCSRKRQAAFGLGLR